MAPSVGEIHKNLSHHVNDHVDKVMQGIRFSMELLKSITSGRRLSSTNNV